MCVTCVLTVFTEMCISLATSAELSRPDRCRSTSCSRSVSDSAAMMGTWSGAPRGGRELVVAWGRGEQAPVGAGQFGVTPQHRSDPAPLHDERQPELFGFGQPQRAGKGAAASRAVTVVVAELSVH